jgi:hypothetical protein
VIIDGYGNRRFYGTYRGVVFDNQDPLGKNRLRLKIPQVLFDEITQWCWGQGSSANPAVGTGVWVTFEGGDPSFPVWAGVFGEATNSMADLKAISPVIYDPATATITLGQIDLANVGTPGTYTKVTTDTKGRVTSGTTLLSSDVPNIAESQVTNLVGDLSTLTNNVALKAPLISPSFTTPSLGAATATSINGTPVPGSTTLLTTAAGSITSSMVLNGTLLDEDISPSAAIAVTKLASSSITINGTTISLGGSSSSVATAGSASGDLGGSYPSPTLVLVGTPGTYPKVTTDNKGRVTSGGLLTSTDIPDIAQSQVTGLVTSLSGKASLAGASFTGYISATNFELTVIVEASNTIALNFDVGEGMRSRIATGAVIFTGAGYSGSLGSSIAVKLVAGTTTRSLTFPTGWVFVGGKPTSLLANKTAVLTATSFGTTEAEVVASWVAQF